MRRLLGTAVIGLMFFAPLSAQTADQKKATLDYVRGLQTPSGAFQPAMVAQQMPSLRATSAAVRAFKYLGGDLPNKEACKKFVHDCFDRDSGGFADQPKGKPDVFTTAVGIMAVVQLKMPVDEYAPGVVKYLGDNARGFDDIRIAVAGLEAIGKKAPQAEQWLAEVRKPANADGTFGKDDGKARDTGGAVVAQLRLGDKIARTDAILTALRSGQRKDGGYGKAGADSDLETSYRVMRAFRMLKATPDAAKLRDFVARCRNADGGYGPAPGKPSNIGGTYFASIILHWLEEK